MGYVSGNTVRFTAAFVDYAGERIGQESVTFKVYDASFNKVFEENITNSVSEQLEYSKEYVVQHGVWYVEFLGMLAGLPALNRQRVEIGLAE